MDTFVNLLCFPSKVKKNPGFWNFEGFSRRWVLCFPGELLQLGLEKNE
jgi:hypothetical protein